MSYWQEKVIIGTRQYSRFIGGPLDGITDSPFRQLVRKFSPDNLLYTEMRHVACVAHDKGGKSALAFQQLERPLNYQIAANATTFIDRACEKIVAAGVDAVDLNIGCPAKNVVRSGGGSSLMADLPRLKKIVSALRAQLEQCTFTVKIRAGYKEKNAVEVAKLLEDCGVDAIAIHPRLQTEKFLGRPDYLIASQIKQAVGVPVLFSGNIVNWKTAKMTYEQTGVDGFLIGRGMWSRPWKLKELDLQSRGEAYAVDFATIFRSAVTHFDLMVSYYGDRGLYNFRKHLPFYLRGFPEALAVRKVLLTETSPATVREKLQELAYMFGERGNEEVQTGAPCHPC